MSEVLFYFPLGPEHPDSGYVVQCPGCGGQYICTLQPSTLERHVCPCCFSVFDRPPLHASTRPPTGARA